MTDFGKTRTAVALGNFDGLHKGHLAVINEAVIQRDNGLLPCIVMFDTHPQKILRGTAPKKLMSSFLEEKEHKKLGCETVRLDFESIRNLSAEEFVRDILIGKLNAAFVSCGFNYRFGKNGEGDAAMLEKLCGKYSLGFKAAESVIFEGESVSSTRIRKALENGETEKANAMLGRQFSYAFEVVTGDKIGGKILGFPTINQFFPEDHIVPKFGVYAAAAEVGGKIYPAMTNIGTRPTVGGAAPRSETCILGFSGDLYGSYTRVMLLSYIREEKKFPSLAALGEQMKKDSVKAEKIFADEVFG